MSGVACSCGDATAHVIARRTTADDHPVALWHDGALTWGTIGRIIEGCALRPTAVDVAAGWLAAGEIELYESSDVPTLIRAARRVAARSGLPGDLRAAMAPRALRAHWVTTEADRDGKAVCAEWHLPCLLGGGGMVVLRERGRYLVMRKVRRSGVGLRSESVLEPVGSWFSSMTAVRAELRAFGVKGAVAS